MIIMNKCPGCGGRLKICEQSHWENRDVDPSLLHHAPQWLEGPHYFCATCNITYWDNGTQHDGA